MTSTNIAVGGPASTPCGTPAVLKPASSRPLASDEVEIDRTTKDRPSQPLISERTRNRAAAATKSARRGARFPTSRLMYGLVIGLQLLAGGAQGHVGNVAAFAGLQRNKALPQIEVPSDQDFLGFLHGVAASTQTSAASTQTTNLTSRAGRVPRRRAQEEIGIFRHEVENVLPTVSPSPRSAAVKRIGRSSFRLDHAGRNLLDATEETVAVPAEGRIPALTDLDQYDYSLFSFNEAEPVIPALVKEVKPAITASVRNGHAANSAPVTRPANHRTRAHRKIDGPSKPPREELPLRYAGR